jgi:hypothetical protein
VRSPGLLMLQPARAGQQAALQPSWVSALYGHKQAAPALRCTQQGRDVDFDTVLMPWREAEPAPVVEELAVHAEGAARALRITQQRGERRFVDHWFHARGNDARRWHIGGFEFGARWAFWRVDADDGRVLHAISHDGASLPRAAATEPAA